MAFNATYEPLAESYVIFYSNNNVLIQGIFSPDFHSHYSSPVIPAYSD